MSEFEPELGYIDIDGMEDERNRIKMCYAFMKSDFFCNQEMYVWDPDAYARRDELSDSDNRYLFSCEVNSGQKLPSLKKLTKMVREKNTVLMCYGSAPGEDELTICIAHVPDTEATEDFKGRQLMAVYLLREFTEDAKYWIGAMLTDDYWGVRN